MWAKWLHHPCRLGEPQRLAVGQKSEIAMWPTCGQSGYITPAVLGVPNAQSGANNQKWLCGPHVGKVATLPLPSLGVPNTQRGDKNQNLRCGPHVGKVTTSPLPSWGSPTLSARTKIRNGYVALMWAKWLHHPCRLGGLQPSARGQKSEMAMLPTCGQSGYITPAILGVPNAVLRSATLSAGTKPRNGYVGHMCPKWLHHPYRLGDPQCLAGGQKSEIAMWPTCGKVATSALPSWGSPTPSAGPEHRIGYVAHMWAKWQYYPYRFGGPQRPARGQKSDMAMWLTWG